jgi:hypothetical protein
MCPGSTCSWPWGAACGSITTCARRMPSGRDRPLDQGLALARDQAPPAAARSPGRSAASTPVPASASRAGQPSRLRPHRLKHRRGHRLRQLDAELRAPQHLTGHTTANVLINDAASNIHGQPGTPWEHFACNTAP